MWITKQPLQQFNVYGRNIDCGAMCGVRDETHGSVAITSFTLHHVVFVLVVMSGLSIVVLCMKHVEGFKIED
jgi:hypothetical protein